jgi:hypothetical protein
MKGKKAEIQDRLKQALIEKGEDLDTHELMIVEEESVEHIIQIIWRKI